MKTMVKIIFIVPLMSAVTLFFSCDERSQSCLVCPPQNTDSTSHQFTWRIDTFGVGGGNILYDVAIIDENNIWAVGEFHLKDSAGNYDYIPYNLLIWSGISWVPKRAMIEYLGTRISPPLYGIFAFSGKDIWVATDIPVHWDGTNWIYYHLFDMEVLKEIDGGVNKVWGKNSSDVYFVGGRGTIVRFNNGNWQRLNSGTTLDIRDIWGVTNHRGEAEILAVASNNSERRLLSIKGNQVTHLADSGLARSLYGVWFVSNCKYYVVGAGIHQKNHLDDPVWSVCAPGVVTSNMSVRVRGDSFNDVFVVGAYFEIVHFNGNSWHNYSREIPYSYGSLVSVAVKGNTVAAVGFVNQRAAIIIGRR